jgi:hypothetical protein
MLTVISEFTQGYPYLIQAVGFEIIEALNSHETLEIADILEIALNNAKNTLFSRAYPLIWDETAKVERCYLTDIADIMIKNNVDTILTRDVVALRHYDSKRLSPLRAQAKHHGTLATDKEGHLSFTLPFFAEYIQTRKHADVADSITTFALTE